MRCRKCQSENLIMRPNAKNPSATEVVCGDCGAWQKFISKDEIRLFELRSSQKKLTNADRIRHMSDEELAWFITLSPEMEFEVCLYCVNGNTVPDDRGICLSPRGVCVANDRHDAFLDWLRQPVKEEHNETD